MTLRIDWVTIDCADPYRLADFWVSALGYERDGDPGDDVVGLLPRDGSKRRVLLLKVPDAKKGKNRLRLDLRPDDQAAEVARLRSCRRPYPSVDRSGRP